MPEDRVMKDELIDHVRYDVNPQPAKFTGEHRASLSDVTELFMAASKSVVPVPNTTYGTCMDERPRVEPEPRFSAPGGPDVYALAVAELTGMFGDSEATGEERLATSTEVINNASIPSGGHKKCAANDLLGVWMPIVADQTDDISEYVKAHMGDDYNPDIMAAITRNAESVKATGRYANWKEEILADQLGEKADKAIEELQDVPHEGIIWVWNTVPGTTVDQNQLNNSAFILDVPYLEKIESAVVSGSDLEKDALLAKHARYAIARALQHALPNEEIYEGTIKQ